MSGQTINHSTPVQVSTSFTAALSSTTITFAFRDDPAFIYFGNASLVNNTTSSGNLLVNGDFATGDLTGWTFANIYGAIFAGYVKTCDGFSPSAHCWYDGSVGAYDAIAQVVATNPGDNYTLSFYYTESSAQGVFSDISTPDLSGINITAYAQAQLPTAAPEPASMTLLGAGFAALGLLRRRRKG
jgi:hypothetical protein